MKTCPGCGRVIRYARSHCFKCLPAPATSTPTLYRISIFDGDMGLAVWERFADNGEQAREQALEAARREWPAAPAIAVCVNRAGRASVSRVDITYSADDWARFMGAGC